MINDLHINEYSEVSVFIHNGQYFCPQVIVYEYMQSLQHSTFPPSNRAVGFCGFTWQRITKQFRSE